MGTEWDSMGVRGCWRYWWRSPRRGAGWFGIVYTNSHVAQLPLASCVSAASSEGLLIAHLYPSEFVLSFIFPV